MRTTLTIDDDLAAVLQKLARKERGSFKQVVNETLRRGLGSGDKPTPTKTPFKVKARACGFLPGIDPFKLNQLVDALELEKFIDDHKTIGPTE